MGNLNLRITKASVLPDGTRRWRAVASDTNTDAEGESTSLELFQDWIDRLEKKKSVPFLPPPSTPFLGVAHYDALDGDGVAGVVDKIYIDGNRLKVAGTFADTPLADALFDAILTDMSKQKSGAVSSPIRISAGWYDLGHRHGDMIFTPKSAADVCPVCSAGNTKGKVYIRGQLEHLAATRVPVNPRTELGLETKSMKKITLKGDAASIVGDELADELEQKSRVIGKSAAIVTKGKTKKKPDNQSPPPPDDIKAEDTKGTEQSPDKGMDGVDCPQCGALLDDVNVGDECPACGYEFTANDLKGGGDESAKKEKSAAANEKSPASKGSAIDTSPVESKKSAAVPFGGAKTIDAAREFVSRSMVGKSRAVTSQTVSNWDVVSGVLSNILEDKRVRPATRIRRALTQLKSFGNELETIKGSVDNAYLVYPSDPDMPMELSTTELSDDGDEYDDAARYLVMEVRNSLKSPDMSKDERLMKIQAALDIFGDVVRRQVEERTPEMEDNAKALDSAVQAAVAPLLDEISALTAKVESLTAATVGKSQATQSPPPPTRKSIVAGGAVSTPIVSRPMKIKDIARQTVGVV